MTTAARITYQDMIDPLFVHPSDNSTSIQVEKLQGSSDYRAWRRSMEINLSSKRKLGFITGTVPKPSSEDTTKTEMWETCNNMVIAWVTNNVSSTIKQSIMYMATASEMWIDLERRFALTNGSRKYKLNRDLYEMKQGSMSVTEFYTSLKSIWAELDALNILPAVSSPTPEVTKLLQTIQVQKEETRLFQFLNGLSDDFNAQRSQILMLIPLPVVETACASLEQEEAQRSLLNMSKPSTDAMAMFSRTQSQAPRYTGNQTVCTACKVKGHVAERCWTVVGYPPWHSRYTGTQSTVSRPRPQMQNTGSRWSKPNTPRLAATAQVQSTNLDDTNGLLFSPQQLEQLAQLMPQLQQSCLKTSESDEELDVHFSGMISAHRSSNSLDWIIDSGASDHMTPCLNMPLLDVQLLGSVSFSVLHPSHGRLRSSLLLLVLLRRPNTGPWL